MAPLTGTYTAMVAFINYHTFFPPSSILVHGAFIVTSPDVLYPLRVAVLSLHAVVPFSCFLDASSLRVQ